MNEQTQNLNTKYVAFNGQLEIFEIMALFYGRGQVVEQFGTKVC